MSEPVASRPYMPGYGTGWPRPPGYRPALAATLEAENAKYGTAYGPDMADPASNSVFALRPEWVFALDSSDFTGSPTRFTFSSS
jgi:hypothetical protein